MHEVIDFINHTLYYLHQEYLNSGANPEGEIKWKKNIVDLNVKMVAALGHGHEMHGNLSTILGNYGNITRAYRETIMGSYATDLAGSATLWVPDDRLWEVGKGPDKDHRAFALRQYKNGFMMLANALAIGAFSSGGMLPVDGSIQYINKRLQLYFDEVWHDLAFKSELHPPVTIAEDSTDLAEIGDDQILSIKKQGITNIVNETVEPAITNIINTTIPAAIKTASGNNHESFLIENTVAEEVTQLSSWTVIPYAEQVGEFKAVVMVRNKALNTIITLMNILSFDYSDAIKVVHQNPMLTDANITLTVGVDAGTSKLYATVAGMTTDNKRIHLCFERCVLGERFFDLEATMELTLEMAATISAYLNVSATSEIQLDMQAVVSTYHNASASPELQLDMLVIPSFYRNLAASSSLILEMLAEVTLVDSISLVDFAVFYNREAVNDSRELAPTGWRIANLTDWTNLINFYGGESLAGGPMKKLETWTTPNSGATADSLFKALPAGQRDNLGAFSGILLKAIFWIK